MIPFVKLLPATIQLFEIANSLIRKRILRIPRLGFERYGKPFYTTSSFQVVDQDQSDNVQLGIKLLNFLQNELILNGKNPQIISNPNTMYCSKKFSSTCFCF
jgi:hypothetical protein